MVGDIVTDREQPFSSCREWIALKIAPWLFVPYREDREEAFKMLAEVAYGSRDAVWTSPTVLAECALEYAAGKRTRSAVDKAPTGGLDSWEF